jgi:putative pyrroloquinoline-quinone-binding quinoprotein
VGVLRNSRQKAVGSRQRAARGIRGRAFCRILASAFCLLLTTHCTLPTAVAQDTPADNWSQFRGNLQLTGVSQSSVPQNLKQLWTFEAGDSIESSAAIVGRTVFVGSQKGELVSLNLDNGAVYWKFNTG